MRKISIAELPVEVRPLVQAGWTAVVYKGIQVYGVFPQMILAQGYVSAVTEDAADRADYQLVAKDGAK